jgi:uncharacterized protein (TIGR02246 family)
VAENGGESGAPEDQQAVGESMMRLANAFRSLDATGVEELYSEDADWTNAFGTTKKGAKVIASYLTELFADPHFGAGKPVSPPQASMRFVTDDVAVVKTYIEREGQQTSSGEQLPIRRNHSLKVFRREEGGWKIVSDIYMDAREEETFAEGG